MAYEQFQIYFLIVMSTFACLTSLFAVLDLLEIRNKKYKGEIKVVMRNVFVMFAIGFILWTAAEIWWGLYSIISGEMTFIGIPDLFWVVGNFLVIGAFVYLSVFMHQKYGISKRGYFLIFAGILLSSVLVFYLVSNFIFGNQQEETTLEILLDYYYPISSAVMIVSSIVVFSFFTKFKGFGRTLLFLALSSAAAFVADMLYTYYTWNGIYGAVGVVSDAFYVLEYMLSFAAFGLLYIVLTREKAEE